MCKMDSARHTLRLPWNVQIFSWLTVEAVGALKTRDRKTRNWKTGEPQSYGKPSL